MEALKVFIMDKRTPLGKFIHNSWTSMNIRCGKYKKHSNKNKNKCYKNIKIVISREDYKKLCYKNQDIILSLKRPSVDRIDSNSHYSINNIQFIELEDNIRKKKVGNKYITNSFGIKRGVRKRGNKFSARIYFNNKEYHLGMFENKEDAYNTFREQYFKFYNKYPF